MTDTCVKALTLQELLDLESLDFHHKVYEGYQMICDKFPDRIVKVDASLPVEEVYRQVYEIVKDRL